MCLTNKTRCRPVMSLQCEADYQPCLAQCQSAGTPIAKDINHNGLLQMLSEFILNRTIKKQKQNKNNKNSVCVCVCVCVCVFVCVTMHDAYF